MAIEVTMPRLSDTMEAGTVIKWHVAEGDEVSSGDVIADIETDKATMELESFDDGTVAKISIPEGEQIAVGSVIMIIAEEGEDASTAASGAGAATTSADAAASASSSTDAPPSSTAVAEPVVGRGARFFASPLARKMAADAGLDLASVRGTGPSGRIVKKDVESALERTPTGAAATPPATPTTPTPVTGDVIKHTEPTERVATENLASAITPASAPPPTMLAPATLEPRTVELSNMRAIIARRLVESKTTIPHYQVTVDVDMDAIIGLRAQLNEQLAPQGVKLTVNDFLVRACALAMHQHPFVNSSWHEDGGQPVVEINGDVNIGIAIALPEERGGGLVVATLRHADRLGLRHISGETKRLAVKSREKGLTIEEMSDSTFTISNLGMFGVSEFTAIINPPNAAILAVGGAMQKPVVKNGELTVGYVMSMTMSSDHRIIDGAMAAQYLATVREMLENPATLMV